MDIRTEQFLNNCIKHKEISVKELLANSDLLGLPAFQRGQVWDGAAATGLLRSLSKGYFVGTLLLWTPKSAVAGVSPLRPGVQPTVLILDGQQRIRALLDAFRPTPDRGTQSVAGSLMCVRPFGETVEISDMPFWRGSRYKAEHTEESTTVPLPVFRGQVGSDAYWTDEIYYDYVTESRDGVVASERWSLSAFEQWSKLPRSAFDVVVGRLLDAKIAIQVLEVEEVVAMDNYRRLNEAGKPLLREELAFAEILRYTRSGAANRALHQSLSLWPDPEFQCRDQTDATGDDGPSLERHDSELTRGDERHFGLKLLVRAVGVAHDLTLSGQHKESDTPLHRRDLKSNADLLLTSAGEAIAALARSLHRLKCDTRSRIPRRDTSGVWGPLLALLIRFPELREPATESHLDALVLGMFLAPARVDANDCFAKVVKSFSAREAVLKLRKVLDADIDAKLNGTVLKVQSSYERYVDLLYWLLRWRGVQDVPVKHRADQIPEINYLSEATRQHIVPWSRLSGRPKRNSSGWINSIGNLTWISGIANGLGGWREKPMEFLGGPSHEQQHFAEGFAAAMKGLRDHPERVLEPSSEECTILRNLVGTEKGGGRTGQIADAFDTWWREIRENADRTEWPEPATAFRREPCLRDLFFSWWLDADLALLAELVIHRTSYPKKNPGKGWAQDIARVRTKRTWSETVPTADSGVLRLVFRGPGEKLNEPIRHLEFFRDRILIPRFGEGRELHGDGSREFSLNSEGEEALKALSSLLIGR